MASWIWVLIPLAAIIGGLIIEYQKNKMTMMNRSQQNEEEVDELNTVVSSLKERIENLEAIAAADPEEFSTGQKSGTSKIEIDDIKKENKQEVSDIANKRRNKA